MPTKKEKEAEEMLDRELADDAAWKKIQQNTFTRFEFSCFDYLFLNEALYLKF